MIDSEKLIEKRLRQHVKALGGLCIKLLSNHFTGLPDRLCLLPGARVIFVEVKTTGKKPTRLQRRVHEQIKALGFPVFVVDRITQIEQLIE